jgi:Na+-translocating ferredoxin:NAD+ oxidoreductase RnfA subunit
VFLTCFFYDNVLLVHGLGARKLFLNPENFSLKGSVGSFALPAVLVFTCFYAVKLVFGFGTVSGVYIPLLLFLCGLCGFFLLNLATSKLKLGPLKDRLRAAFFDPLVWGLNLICIYRNHHFLYGVCFLVLGIIGYFLLLGTIRCCIDDKKVPTCLQGSPILLIYVGVLSLAYFGFVGNQVLV